MKCTGKQQAHYQQAEHNGDDPDAALVKTDADQNQQERATGPIRPTTPSGSCGICPFLSKEEMSAGHCATHPTQ